MIKKVRYFLELIAVRIAFFIFTILGLKNSSNLGSFLTRKVGKLLSVHKLARNNMKKALPDLSDVQIENNLNDMWDNLGRIAGEFIHCCRFTKSQIMNYIQEDKDTLKNIENIKKNYNGGIIFSAHTGSWEVGPKFFSHHGINVKSVYRPLNNMAVENLTSKIRHIDLIPKTTQGNKQIISEIKKGNYIIIMADQKVSNGVDVPFFHDKALTTPSIAKLALKYDIPLIPTRIVRIGKGFKFRVDVEKPIKFKKEKVISDEQIFSLTKKINEKLESWIRQYPAQWFWVHNRWKR